MAGAVISIDRAAAGLLPHRFVRAMSASTLVLIATLTIGLLVYSMATTQVASTDEVAGVAIGAVLIGVVLTFGFGLLIAVIGGLFDAVHRSLIALVMLIVNAAVIVIAAVGAVIGAAEELGWVAPQGETAYASWQNWSMVVLLALAGFIAFEGLRWSWWQLRAPRADFLAVRGWRSPPWRLYSSMRQRLGLPAFISNFGRGRMSLTLIYFLVAVLNMGLIALLVVPFVIFMIEQDGKDSVILLICAAAFLGLVVLNFLGAGALLQHIAAARATKLYQDAREWDSRPPVVFLRAFDQDAAKLKALSRDWFVKFPAGCGEARTLDEILLENASVYGPVIAIGDPRDPTPPLGAARVFVKGEGVEWQGVVTQLVGASSAVIMCPSTSEGVQWELDLIADAQGRVRTILLANPELSAADTAGLFRRFAPHAPSLATGQAPIAAWTDPEHGWVVLTTSKPPCVQTYTVALNYALQDLFGMKGVPVRAAPKRRRAA